MLDNQGTYLFDIFNPEVIPQNVSVFLPFLSAHVCDAVLATLLLSSFLSVLQGSVVIQMDFGFPHHLLVEFLQKTLQ